MTALQKTYGPWAVPAPLARIPTEHCIICGAKERVEKILDSSDVEWLKAVITDPDGGRTVKLAAERRLRRLKKK